MKEIIVGIYSQVKDKDFGFVDEEISGDGFFVHMKNKSTALNGDKVEAEIKEFRGKKEAIITKVLERKTDLVVGEYMAGKDNRFGFVVARNSPMKNDVFVPGKKSMEAKTGDIVGVQITSWKGKNPEGTIREILGKKGDKSIDVLSIALEGGARIKFPLDVLKYVKNIPYLNPLLNKEGKTNEVSRGGREDLTGLFTFTIDGEDAKDLDDAISIKRLDNGDFKLFVHIADVSHYVSENSVLDKEAYKRATSTYLADRVIPMLPEKLSNDLCSLNPNTEKLTLTCEMIINKTGRLKSQKVYNSIIKSDFRLTYKEVDDIISGKLLPPPNPLLTKEGEGSVAKGGGLHFGGIVNEKLLNVIKLSNTLKREILNYRHNNGVLDFDFPETKLDIDENGEVQSIKQYPRYDSNKMIESFMVSANEAVSKEFSDLPFLYRIHEEPSEEDLNKLQETLNLFGIDYKITIGDTKDFAKLLSEFNGIDEGKKMFLEKAVLRTLTKAVYSRENQGHFGLGLSYYSHFTSPIRRYPDLQIHRIIKEKISGRLNKTRLIHYKSILDTVAKHTSDKERKAEKLEYSVRDYFTVQYYKNKVGEVFNANISGVLTKGLFVALEDTSEGFVEMNNSVYDEAFQKHKDLSSGIDYKLGDSIKVKLIEADEVLFRLNFAIVK